MLGLVSLTISGTKIEIKWIKKKVLIEIYNNFNQKPLNLLQNLRFSYLFESIFE